MRRILDAEYENTDLNKVMTKQCQHLSTKERYTLLSLLNRFKDLFYRTTVTWNTTLVDMGLKDNSKPVCLQTYLVPRVHEEMSKTEVKILVGLDVTEHANEY